MINRIVYVYNYQANSNNFFGLQKLKALNKEHEIKHSRVIIIFFFFYIEENQRKTNEIFLKIIIVLLNLMVENLKNIFN